MIAMAIVGCLFVIPTAAEIPIVQTMMLAGMGMAPALALLITLPAVSLPSLIMLRKSFPAKALWMTAGTGGAVRDTYRSDCAVLMDGGQEKPGNAGFFVVTPKPPPGGGDRALLDKGKRGSDVFDAADAAGDVRRSFAFTVGHGPIRNTSPFSVVTFTLDDFTRSLLKS